MNLDVSMLFAVQAALLLIFPVLVIVAALRDVTSFTIPNWISLALIVAFFPAAFILGLGWPQIGLHAGAGALALVAGMAMFALRWIGGGDAKLFAAAALWLGAPAALSYLVMTGLAGGALALALISLRSPILRPYVLSGPAWFGRLADPDEAVPYGVAIAAGALATFADSPLMQAWPGF